MFIYDSRTQYPFYSIQWCTNSFNKSIWASFQYSLIARKCVSTVPRTTIHWLLLFPIAASTTLVLFPSTFPVVILSITLLVLLAVVVLPVVVVQVHVVNLVGVGIGLFHLLFWMVFSVTFKLLFGFRISFLLFISLVKSVQHFHYFLINIVYILIINS